MLNEIKRRLIENPEKIVDILEYYGYKNPKIRNNRIEFGLDANDSESSSRSKYIKLENNNWLCVKDKSQSNYSDKDLLNYIMVSKHQEFKDVINKLKAAVGVEDEYYRPKRVVFGGFYEKLAKHRKAYKQKTYDNSILNNYVKMNSYTFIKDYITSDTQRKFNVMYDPISQRIVFPIYDWQGNIIGIKGRATWELSEDESKYIYLVNCNVNNTLFGYAINYSYLQDSTIVICESEKAVMQAYSYGFRNMVSLSCSSITPEQCRLIVQLNPKRVIFANDEGLDMDTIQDNVNKLKVYNRYKEMVVSYWDYTKSDYMIQQNQIIKDKTNGEKQHCKLCITDLGKDIFYNILQKELHINYEERMEINQS